MSEEKETGALREISEVRQVPEIAAETRGIIAVRSFDALLNAAFKEFCAWCKDGQAHPDRSCFVIWPEDQAKFRARELEGLCALASHYKANDISADTLFDYCYRHCCRRPESGSKNEAAGELFTEITGEKTLALERNEDWHRWAERFEKWNIPTLPWPHTDQQRQEYWAFCRQVEPLNSPGWNAPHVFLLRDILAALRPYKRPRQRCAVCRKPYKVERWEIRRGPWERVVRVGRVWFKVLTCSSDCRKQFIKTTSLKLAQLGRAGVKLSPRADHTIEGLQQKLEEVRKQKELKRRKQILKKERVWLRIAKQKQMEVRQYLRNNHVASGLPRKASRQDMISQT